MRESSGSTNIEKTLLNAGSNMTVTDRETKVEVDLLPGGMKIDPGPLKLPMPSRVSQAARLEIGGVDLRKDLNLHWQGHRA